MLTLHLKMVVSMPDPSCGCALTEQSPLDLGSSTACKISFPILLLANQCVLVVKWLLQKLALVNCTGNPSKPAGILVISL
jgi:hypothetical protein